jgi:hypothetical protein
MRADKLRRTHLSKGGRLGIANLGDSTARGTIPLVGPIYLGHLLLILLATLMAWGLVVVDGRPLAEALQSVLGNYAPRGKLVPISHGYIPSSP